MIKRGEGSKLSHSGGKKREEEEEEKTTQLIIIKIIRGTALSKRWGEGAGHFIF